MAIDTATPSLRSEAPDTLRVHPDDHVATALRDLAIGETVIVDGAALTLVDPVPRGHKLAIRAIAPGEPVLKFGFPIGRATASIAAGAHVHTHNLHTALEGQGDYAWHPEVAPPAPVAGAPHSFRGYVRADGQVGTRNEIWVLPTVGCVARTAQRIAATANDRHRGRVDGVHAFSHPFGCSQLGDDLDGTRSLLASLAAHPNAGGVLLVGLGCEENQLDALIAELPPERRHLVRSVAAQLSDDELADGLAAVDALVEQAATARREDVPLSRLTLGVKCGGSDGLSGLTANPLVGRMADAVAAAGGRVILTEIPEIFGAEQLLMDRAESEGVFEEVVDLVNGFKRYFIEQGQPVSENPSPGNIAGGITTLEEKSLGAVQKGGRARLSDVRRYGQRLRKDGLTLLEAPGNDAVSSTALSAAGATVILFTTGRGTPLGFPVPTVKIASNSGLAARKPGWIDFDAGQALGDGLDATADTLLARICAIASGEETAAERNGEREIAIWKRGVTL
jgi:altronate hydrolase